MIKHTLLSLLILAAFIATAWHLGIGMASPTHLGAVVGACSGSSIFISREIAQAEYRWMKANGMTRATAPWYCGVFPSAWNKKSVTDMVVPSIVTIALAVGVILST